MTCLPLFTPISLTNNSTAFQGVSVVPGENSLGLVDGMLGAVKGGMEGCVSRKHKEAWQWLGGVKKYKSGEGNWEKFSWDEPTTRYESVLP